MIENVKSQEMIFPKWRRYNVAGFVEELPQLPSGRYDHACARLPDTGVRTAPVNCPTRWPLSLLFGFMWWSSGCLYYCTIFPNQGAKEIYTAMWLTRLLILLQALVVAGGCCPQRSSVLSLLPGATAWLPLASLPKRMFNAQASIVGGKLRVNGGFDGRTSTLFNPTVTSWNSEVEKWSK